MVYYQTINNCVTRATPKESEEWGENNQNPDIIEREEYDVGANTINYHIKKIFDGYSAKWDRIILIRSKCWNRNLRKNK